MSSFFALRHLVHAVMPYNPDSMQKYHQMDLDGLSIPAGCSAAFVHDVDAMEPHCTMAAGWVVTSPIDAKRGIHQVSGHEAESTTAVLLSKPMLPMY